MALSTFQFFDVFRYSPRIATFRCSNSLNMPRHRPYFATKEPQRIDDPRADAEWKADPGLGNIIHDSDFPVSLLCNAVFRVVCQYTHFIPGLRSEPRI
jgi:hypothetical protein